ncbi:IS4 family transposase, partial [Paraburkholderia atlantica]|uniref:IS4 family transposase n=2 Tax=Paraburkholderia atlantica TaxID=2654982 RepID=UPI001D110B38
QNRRREKLPEIDVFAIHALETNVDEGAEPLEWLLLTSVPTYTQAQALERLAWYARRWTIESWHRVLKSGCRIETRQFGNVERFVRATALFAVVSWRILYGMLLARLDGNLSCEVLLQPIEWQALYCRTHGSTEMPDEPPSLAQVILWIARLGGYLARKRDHPPGPTVIWRGFLVLHEITMMYRIFRASDGKATLPALPPLPTRLSIERTLFILDWLQNVELRRRVHAGLNKGEARNALARSVFFYRLGEIRDRSFEAQRYRASGLNLVTAAIVLWNTVYLERAVQTMHARGVPADATLLPYLSPLGWEHINLTGDYVWHKDRKLQAGRFRPLRPMPGAEPRIRRPSQTAEGSTDLAAIPGELDIV